MKKRNGYYINCSACKESFYVPAYREKTARFCSIYCQNHRRYEKFIFECRNCKKIVTASPSRKIQNKKFCSISCRDADRKTEKERRQQIKALNVVSRGVCQARTFRRNFFKLMEKKCCECGYDEHDYCLDLHHIDGNCNNNTIENIAVLCVMCHRKLHKGKK